MTEYRRNWSAGGTCFCTVVAANRSSGLLVEHIDQLREAFCSVRDDQPFSIDAMVVLPGHLHAIWMLPPDDFDYASRWKGSKPHSQGTCPKASSVQVAAYPRVNAVSGSAGTGSTRFAMTRISGGTSTTYTSIRRIGNSNSIFPSVGLYRPPSISSNARQVTQAQPSSLESWPSPRPISLDPQAGTSGSRTHPSALGETSPELSIKLPAKVPNAASHRITERGRCGLSPLPHCRRLDQAERPFSIQNPSRSAFRHVAEVEVGWSQ